MSTIQARTVRRLQQLRKERDDAQATFRKAVVSLLDAGHSPASVARAAGLTRQAVSQFAQRRVA